MSGDRQSQILLGVLLTVILIGTTLVSVFMFSQMGDPDAQYKQSYTYDVSGTVNGSEAIGEGVSEYKFEPSGFVYMVTTTYSYPGSEKEQTSFSVICSSKEGPATEVYKRLGDSTVDGVPCTLWTYDVEGSTVEFSIDADLVVHSYTITHDGFHLKGSLVGPKDKGQ